jgi:hypothetical protein
MQWIISLVSRLAKKTDVKLGIENRKSSALKKKKRNLIENYAKLFFLFI